jgi:hypothetical protein
MINVVQILLGDCPPFIAKCMQTVNDYADSNGYTYTVISSIPDWYRGGSSYAELRTLSEWMRLDILAEQSHTLYVDWDIKLKPSFIIPDGLTLSPQIFDCMIYNHTDTGFFREARKSVSWGSLIMCQALTNMLRMGGKYLIFNMDDYTHYEYSCNKQFLSRGPNYERRD